MQKKTLYWTLGILAALVIVLLIWSATASGRTAKAPESSPGSSLPAQDQTDHSQMGHGQSPSPADSDLQKYLTEQDTIMMDMMDKMGNIEPTGSAAIDFLTGMIPHHESAVAMAESYLAYGGDQEALVPLAQDIMTTQKAEIEQMNTMIQNLKSNLQQDQAQEDAYLQAYHALMGSHTMTHSTADSIDKAFAEGMMTHHQMAVDMAKDILAHTDEDEVLQLAQTIIDTQSQEIADMQIILESMEAAPQSN